MAEKSVREICEWFQRFAPEDEVSDAEQALLERRVVLTDKLVATLFGTDKRNAIRCISALISLEQLERVVQFLESKWVK